MFQPVCARNRLLSHSSTESEVMSLDAGLRMDGISALDLWDLVIQVVAVNWIFSFRIKFVGLEPISGDV